MGSPKQWWTSKEEASLRAGVAKYGVGKWRAILKDPQFSSTLCHRSNVDLKDKWRNINSTGTSASRAKGRAVLKKTQSAPKVRENTIMEVIKSLNEPMGSHRTTIADYMGGQYWSSSGFDQLLSAKLKDLTTSEKSMKVNQKYKIAPISPISDSRMPKTLLLGDMQREPSKFVSDDIKTLTRSQVDAELAQMATMTPEEAAAAAARAVEEAEAIMAEAEAAAREAEVAEANARAAQANARAAQAAFSALKNRKGAKSKGSSPLKKINATKLDMNSGK